MFYNVQKVINTYMNDECMYQHFFVEVFSQKDKFLENFKDLLNIKKLICLHKHDQESRLMTSSGIR